MNLSERAPPGMSETFTYEENKTHYDRRIESSVQQNYNDNVKNLHSFLRESYNFGTESKDPTTNVVDQSEIKNGRSTWNFPPDKFGEFMGHLEKCRIEGSSLHLSERQQYEGKIESGIMLDFDVKFHNNNPKMEKKHKMQLTEKVIEIIRGSMDSLEIPGSGALCETYVGFIERPYASSIMSDDKEKKLYKKGFHILIPGLCLSRPHKKYVIKQIKESENVHITLRDFGVINAKEACDTNSASVPVLFLGSCKSGGVLYQLTTIFKVSLDIGFIRAEEIDLKLLAGYNMCWEFCLTHEARYPEGKAPLIRKHSFRHAAFLEEKINTFYERSSNNIIPSSELFIADNNVNLLVQRDPNALHVQGMLEILSPAYYTEYNKWRDVIFALANSSTGCGVSDGVSIDYKPLAIWFSQKSPDAWKNRGGQEELNKLWEESRARSTNPNTNKDITKLLTVRSIAYWARQCNEEKYFAISKDGYNQKLLKWTYETEGKIEQTYMAELLYDMLKHKFRCDNEGKKDYVWFEFMTKEDQKMNAGEIWKWRREPADPITLRRFISEKIKDYLIEIKWRIEDRRSKETVKEKAKYYAGIIKNLKSYISKTLQNTFKNQVIAECRTMFLDRTFSKKLDTFNTNVLGVGNGLLVLGESTIFIDHYHEYPISKSTPVMWRGHFKPDSPTPYQQKLLDMVSTIIPERDARIKILMFLSTGLTGGMKEQPLLLLRGGGANGKTTLMTLTIQTLGDMYAANVNSQVYSTQPEGADRPNSALMQFKGKYFTVGEETNKGDPLNPVALKTLIRSTGASARDLNKTQEQFAVYATQIVTSQYEFKVPTTDHGTWRRLETYIHKTKFCAKPNPNNPYEVAADPKMVKEIPYDTDYQSAWLSILAYFYEWFKNDYKDYDKIPSKTIDAYTARFRDEQDRINKFITERIVKSPKHAPTGADASLELVATKYIQWHEKMFNTRGGNTLESVMKDFELSYLEIGSHIRRNGMGEYELQGCRVLDEKDTLREGETFLLDRSIKEFISKRDNTPFWWKKDAETENNISREDKKEEKEGKEEKNEMTSSLALIPNDDPLYALKKPETKNNSNFNSNNSNSKGNDYFSDLGM